MGLFDFFSSKSKESDSSKKVEDIIPANLRVDKNAEPEPKTLEESWGFLYRMADRVKQIFSQEDFNVLLQLGALLKKIGFQYIHVVPPTVLQQRSHQATAVQKASSQPPLGQKQSR